MDRMSETTKTGMYDEPTRPGLSAPLANDAHEQVMLATDDYIEKIEKYCIGYGNAPGAVEMVNYYQNKMLPSLRRIKSALENPTGGEYDGDRFIPTGVKIAGIYDFLGREVVAFANERIDQDRHPIHEQLLLFEAYGRQLPKLAGAVQEAERLRNRLRPQLE